MAFETGTATDYRDLLQKLKAFLTNTTSPESGLAWTVMEERSQSTSPQTHIAQGDADELMETEANNDQSHDQIIFRGTGGVSPENNVYFGIQTYGLSTTGYYNWQIRGLTGYSNTSPQTSLASQPGRSPPVFLMLQNTTMTYWFMANDRHVKGAVRTGSSYQPFYIGFGNPFATEAEYPYPMVISGTYHEENRIFSTNVVDTASLCHPAGNNDSDTPGSELYPASSSSMFVRFNDGNWYAVKNFYASGANEVSLTGSQGNLCIMHPLGAPDISQFNELNVINDNLGIGSDFRSLTPGGTPNYQMLRSLGSPELTPLWPLIIIQPQTNNILMELDGCYWCPGAGGLTSEDIVTDFGESPEVANYVFQSVHRTDGWMYQAIRAD